MRRASAIVVIALIAVVTTVVYKTQRINGPAKPYSAPTPNAASPARQSRFEFVSADTHDPEFTKRVLPIVSEFVATLDRAGVNPLEGDLQFNKIQIHHGPNGMGCRFLIGSSWTATVYDGKKFSGVMHFGQRGPDNPFRAISGANTNALIRLSERAIKMPETEAARIIEHVAATFEIDLSAFEKPEIFAEQMFEYDLGLYTAKYRKKGSDPINQLNYPISFTIRATSPGTAVLVMYSANGEAKFRR